MNNPLALDDNQLAARFTRYYAGVTLCLLPLPLITRVNAKLPVDGLWYLALAVVVFSFFLTSKLPRLKVKYCVTLNILMALCTLLPSNQIADLAAETNMSISYFGTYKVMAMIVALLAPFPYYVGYILLSFCLLLPPLQVLLFSPEIMRVTGYYEPWITMCYALVSFLVLHHRRSTLKIHAHLIESQAKEKSLRDFADVAMALRDLTNTPLQSLDLLIELLREEKISQKQASELLGRTTYRLRELMQVLSEQQKKIARQQVQQSMDSMDVIRQAFGSINNYGKKDD